MTYRIDFTNNHFDTAHQALEAANKLLAANGLPLFTYGPKGSGGGGNFVPSDKYAVPEECGTCGYGYRNIVQRTKDGFPVVCQECLEAGRIKVEVAIGGGGAGGKRP